MSTTTRARALPSPVEGDGTDTRLCSDCAFAGACADSAVDRSDLGELHCGVQHVGPFRQGQHVFRVNDPLNAIYAVRAGMIKTCVGDAQGREQVLGFHVPGEVITVPAGPDDRYPCDAMALDRATLCRFSWSTAASLATRAPRLHQHLLRTLHMPPDADTRRNGSGTTEQRVAAFVCDLSRRLAAQGGVSPRIRLTMPRSDVANYLHLAAETVSRLLRQFQDESMISLEGRELEIRDFARLQTLADC